ncbi:SGNH/GDSL hydrolase family protein [Paenibacillus soyae]|uniref:SGNH/GDSL hydrolase family protein n=1 Tax=Paenibacillus soyae TaxID=2969249 RepID=A0A9X2MS65_9BACL|nr:SGNH/GDSL hydrolase family protein [Paenibacillus soyae]MCR2804858.1 SGNH/GDSL hydrolase family protein [Paenibacillus soyae]
MTIMKVENMALTYTGSWTVRQVDRASLGSLHESCNEADTHAAAFWEGCFGAMRLFASTGPSLGIAEVWIDGELRSSIDLYAPDDGNEACVFSMELAPGFHTVEIRKSGRKHPLSSAYSITIDHLTAALARPERAVFRQIVCIGDSITFGANVEDRPRQLFGRKLQAMLSAPVSIHGLSGASISRIASVLDAVAAPREPDLILWLAGMNDRDPREPLLQGIGRLRALMPRTKLIMSNIPYNTHYTEVQNETKAFGVLQVCRQLGIPCADLYAATRGQRSLHLPEDTVHPNADGHTLIAALFYKEIMKLEQP